MAPALIQEVAKEPEGVPTIQLTPVEANLRQLLLDVADFTASDSASQKMNSQVKMPDALAREPVVLRFTGGWVRDKLLGVPSHDIDVAINKMTGEQFGLCIKDYLEIPGNPEKYGLDGVATTDKENQKAESSGKSTIVGGLHKIEANPEKSKHLETVTTTIFGLDIDLVNLRKETYSDDSRNPQIEFGTPEEDALRRDATVNAMFYNLNTQMIEDFTERGHKDMAAHIIRTPLEPYQTFKDDPLRVLRLIRFASRLGYKIDDEALQAMRNPDILAALQKKISRERVGVELEKALRGPDPYEALRLIFDLDLYFTTFCDPTVPDDKHFRPEQHGWKIYLDALRDVIDNDRAIAQFLIRDPEERFLAWQLAGMVPYRNAPQAPPSAPGRRPPPPVASSVAREGIKSTNKVTEVITLSTRHQEEISRLVDEVRERKRRPESASRNGQAHPSRDTVGMAIRRWGSTWRSQVVYSYLVDIADTVDQDGTAGSVETKYDAFLQHLSHLNLYDAYLLKPLLDGKALAKALDTAPGPWMKDALDVVMAWQLRNPDCTDPQEAIEQVRQKRGELSSALVQHFLKLTIRPLFSKTKPSSVTDGGRKLTGHVLPTKITGQDFDESVDRPWKKGKEQYAMDLFSWSVGALDPKLTEDLWPLIIPPLLVLIDDREPKYKALGALQLQTVLSVTTSTLLGRTGLGEVFEQALLPCLMYVPPVLSSEEESIELLDRVFPALLALNHVRYSAGDDAPQQRSDRIRCLDNIVCKGVLYVHESCPQHPNILRVAYKHLPDILRALGIDTVKHVRALSHMLTESLCSETLCKTPAQHATLAYAARSLHALVINAWPRASEYRGEYTKAIAVCWILSEKQSPGELRTELRKVAQALRASLNANEAMGAVYRNEVEGLVQSEPRLAELLQE